MFKTKKISILIILFFVCVNNLFSQEYTIEFLEKQLLNATENDKPEILLALSEKYLSFDLNKSIFYASEGITISLKTGTDDLLPEFYNILGSAYLSNEDYKSALTNFEKELKIIEASDDLISQAICSYNIATCYSLTDKQLKAISSYEESLEISKKINSKDLILKNYEALFDLNYQISRYKKALEYFDLYVAIKDSTFKTQSLEQITVLRKEKEETEKKLYETDSTLKVIDSTKNVLVVENTELQVISEEQNQKIDELTIEQKLSQQQIKNQKLRNNILFIIIIFIAILTILILYSYHLKKESNKTLTLHNKQILLQNQEIENQRNEIEKQKDLLEIKNNEITSSIVYAQRIQNALFPSYELFKKHFSDFVIFFKPRDIVSGDFYWIKQVNDFVIFAAADCTGHGVPGAFMSMLAISLLNEIVQKREISQTNQILEELRTNIKNSLQQTGKELEQKDGLDIAICAINYKLMILQYAGANNSIYFIRNNEFTEFKPVRNPIGIYIKEKPFENISFDIQKDDTIFMFTDGFPDQIGGEKVEKFKYRPFKELLSQISQNDSQTQYNILNTRFEEWMGIREQIDDILVLGVRI